MWNIWGKSDVFSLLKSPDAKRVMEHKPHILDKHYIDVSWLEEEESGSTEEAGNVVDRESATRIPEPERTLTISVSGFSSSTTELLSENTLKTSDQQAEKSRSWITPLKNELPIGNNISTSNRFVLLYQPTKSSVYFKSFLLHHDIK